MRGKNISQAKWITLCLSVLIIVFGQTAFAAQPAAPQAPGTSKQSAVVIPSTNPDDLTNKSRAWRKRKADLSKKDIQSTKKTMKQQAISKGL